jgi:hypothetical protein
MTLADIRESSRNGLVVRLTWTAALERRLEGKETEKAVDQRRGEML